MTPDQIRTLLLQVWGEQACMRASNWPDALARMRVAQANKRGSITPWIEHAVLVLGETVAAGRGVRGEDVWKAFSKLDGVHREKLARLLNAAAPKESTVLRERVD